MNNGRFFLFARVWAEFDRNDMPGHDFQSYVNWKEDVELDQRKAMPLAIFKLLKELWLSLVIEVGILCVLDILKPDSWINDFRVCLHGATHALIDRKGHAVFHGIACGGIKIGLVCGTRCQLLLRFLHLSFKVRVLLTTLTNSASLCCIHLVLGCLFDDVVVLQAYYLVDTITEAGHFLALLMQQILR